MNGFRQDVAYGLRSLTGQRAFTLVAVVVLGSAIGLSTSVFTAFNTVAFRPWPVPDAGRVVKVFHTSARGAGGLSLAEARHLAQHARSFTGVAAMRDAEIKLGDRGMGSQYVTGNFFATLRVPMQKGRHFLPEEDVPSDPRAVTILSGAAWQRLFAADPGIVGRSVRLNGIPFTVVGVTTAAFYGTEMTMRDLWVPFAAMRLLRPNDPSVDALLTAPNHCCLRVAARLADGISREQGTAELQHLSRQFQSRTADDRGILLTDTALLSDPGAKRQKMFPAFGLMFLAVTLVLVLACANVGNLLLARAAARRHEIAVRLSLGATRVRVIRQLLTEGFILATAAGVVGFGVAFVLPSYVLSLQTSSAARMVPDGRVLLYTVAMAVATCLAFALAPALHCTRGTVSAALDGRGSAGRRRSGLRDALLAVQVAVSVVLLVGAGLLVRGLRQAHERDLGLAVKDVALVSFSLPPSHAGRGRALMPRLSEELAALPGAPPYAFTIAPPLGFSRHLMPVRLPGQEQRPGRFIEVSPGYVDVLRIPVLEGRSFTAADDLDAVVLVNEPLARQYWPGRSAVGETLIVNVTARQVLGVLQDEGTIGIGETEPTFYVPFGRGPTRGDLPYVLLRDPSERASREMAALAARLDPQATATVSSLAANVERWLAPARITALLAGGVGLLALGLATLGLSGVFAYAVHQRTREIGIRMALGARAADVVRVVLASSSRAIVIGLAIGTVAAIATSHLLRGRLFGLSPLDPAAYAGVALLLAIAGLAASYVPARRALRIEPTVALRYE